MLCIRAVSCQQYGEPERGSPFDKPLIVAVIVERVCVDVFDFKNPFHAHAEVMLYHKPRELCAVD